MEILLLLIFLSVVSAEVAALIFLVVVVASVGVIVLLFVLLMQLLFASMPWWLWLAPLFGAITLFLWSAYASVRKTSRVERARRLARPSRRALLKRMRRYAAQATDDPQRAQMLRVIERLQRPMRAQ